MRLDTEISSFLNLRVAFGITCSLGDSRIAMIYRGII